MNYIKHKYENPLVIITENGNFEIVQILVLFAS